MDNLYDTECKEVMDTSDCDDHQLQGTGSHQILSTEVANDYSGNTELFRRLLQINDARKPSHSTSDRSGNESLGEFEFRPTPKLWLEIEEKENGRDRYEPKDHDSLLSVSPRVGENENKRKWQSFKQSHVENGEQWSNFDQNITDTLTIADAYVERQEKGHYVPLPTRRKPSRQNVTKL